MGYRNFRKSGYRTLRRLGLPHYKPHDLRHKGHSSIKITVDRSGHLTLNDSEDCRQVIEATFRVHMLSGSPAPPVPAAESVPAWPGKYK